MLEIARVTLQNEMDLILANKRAMVLAELAGFSIGSQTTFATAVSEVSRSAIERCNDGCLTLGVNDERKRDKYLFAAIKESGPRFIENENIANAQRLADKFTIVNTADGNTLSLDFFIPGSAKLTAPVIESWKTHFINEPPFSPYEEIKRKNEQLQLVASKLLESESQYKTLTNSLPINIFSLNLQQEIVYANEWLTSYSGCTIESINRSKWQNVIHPDDYKNFSNLLKRATVSESTPIKIQSRLKQFASDKYLWHLVSLSPIKDDKQNIVYWIGFLVDINAEKIVEETLQENRILSEKQSQFRQKEKDLQEDITELNRSNTELSQFAYIASHDLQEPLRKMILYSDYLVNKNADKLDARSVDYLKNMNHASYRMRTLIEDILSFSQVNNKELLLQPLDLNVVIQQSIADYEMVITESKAIISTEVLPIIQADPSLIQQLFNNIISNALKYSREAVPPIISINAKNENDEVTITISDNGIGFEEKYLDKIFTLFQRLHGKQAYSGNGLGLAICRKIVQLHNGSIYAKSAVNEGSTFFIKLPIKNG
ncbi:MAG: ATP-binding protein [Bacteroidota bacterium]